MQTETVILYLVLQLGGSTCWDGIIVMGLFVMVTQIQSDCDMFKNFKTKSHKLTVGAVAQSV
jgi:hypothetical protein